MSQKEQQTPSSMAGISVSIAKRGGGPQKGRRRKYPLDLVLNCSQTKMRAYPRPVISQLSALPSTPGLTLDPAPKAAERVPADLPYCESCRGDLAWREWSACASRAFSVS